MSELPDIHDPEVQDRVRGAIDLLISVCHGAAKARGWHTDLATGEPVRRNFGEMIALIHSEFSEALEGHRKNRQDEHLPHRPSVEVELSDGLIRTFDLSGIEYLDLDVAGAFVDKLIYNDTRPDHDPANRVKADGKKY